MKESLGEDRTEKHFLSFLQDVFEQVQTMRPSANLIWEYLTFWIHQDFDKDVLSGMSDRLISTVSSLLENHVLHYSCIDSGDLKSFSAIGCLPVSIKVHISGDVEFLSSLVWIVMTCLHSGGYTTVPSGAPDANIGR